MNVQELKRRNKAQLMKLFCIHRRVSRMDLVHWSGMSKMTITNLVNEFLEEGILRRAGVEESSIGRRGELLELVADSVHTIGVQITHHGLFVTSVALDGSFDPPLRQNLDADTTPEQLRACIHSAIASVRSRRLHQNIVIATVGIAYPDGSGIELGTFFPRIGCLEGIGPWLEEQFQLPVYIENDTNVAALSELYLSQTVRESNFAYLQIDEGLGAGVVLGGRLFSTQNRILGELGHMTIDCNGPRCRCGNRGCLEQYASTAAILQWYHSQGGSAPNWDALVEQARIGIPLALAAMERGSRMLASGLVNLTNLLDVERIYIGDRGAALLEFSGRALEEAVNTRKFQKRRLHIQPARYFQDARIRGIALLPIEREAAGEVL